MIRRIIFTLGSKAGMAIINFLMVVVLSRYLGAEGKGVCSLVVSLLAAFLIFNNVGGGPVLIYLVPRYPAGRLLMSSYAWLLLVAVLFYIILQFYPVIDPVYHIHVLLIALLHALSSIHMNVMLGEEKSKAYNVLSFLQVIVTFGTLCMLLVPFSQRSVMSYIYALYAGYGLITIISFFMAVGSRLIAPTGPSGHLREMFRLGAVNQLAMLAQFITYRLGYYVLEGAQGNAAVGVYSNATSVAETVWLMSASVSVILYARIANSDDETQSALTTIQLARLSLVLSAVAVTILAVLPSEVYTMVFGRDFSAIRPAILWLLPGILVFSLNIVCSNFFSGTGRIRVNTYASVIGMIITVVLSFALVPRLGLAGAAIAASASYLITTIYTLTNFFRLSGLDWGDLVPRRTDIDSLKHLFYFRNDGEDN